MKSLFRLSILLLASSMLVLTGCSKKPQRPNPSQTILGQSENASLNPTAVGGLFGDDDTSLGPRIPGEDMAAGQRGILKSVYFDFDSAAIRIGERAKLNEAKTYLDANPNARVVLEGHCDWRGTTEYNMGLGDRRAAAVRDFLGTLGVTASRLETLSKGDLEATEGASESQMQEDRRVELVVFP